MNNAEFRAYFDRIESYFAVKRQQVLLLSPEEYELVEKWFVDQVPVELVIRGIDRFFEKKKKSTRKSHRQVFLTHVAAEVEDIVADYNKKGVGSYLATGPTETQFIVEKLNAIMFQLERVDNRVQALAKDTLQQIAPLLAIAEEETFQEIESRLECIADVAKDKIFDTLDPELERQIEDRIQTILDQSGHPIADSIKERFRIETLLEILKFPALTLYS